MPTDLPCNTWVDMDLSTASFLYGDDSHTPPTGGQYGDGVIYKTTEVPPQVTNYPDFWFPWVLDPTKQYQVEVTFDPTSVHDAGGRGFWLTGIQPGNEQASTDLTTPNDLFTDLYDGTGNTADVVTVIIGPGIGGWDDATFGVAAGWSRVWFETDTAGAVSAVRVRKICADTVRPSLDFFFSDYVLDPEKPHRVEITFNPESDHDRGGRGFWLTGVRDHYETDDYYDLIGRGPGFANLYDGSNNLADQVTIVIGPEVGGWDDSGHGVAAGYDRIWFATDASGAVSEVVVTKICTTPPPPPPPPPPPVKSPPEPTHPEVASKPSGPPAPAWAADVRISMPAPPNRSPQVSVGGGFAFTSGGLVHDISEAVYKQLSTPSFAPTEYGQEVVYDDVDLSAPPSDVKVF